MSKSLIQKTTLRYIHTEELDEDEKVRQRKSVELMVTIFQRNATGQKAEKDNHCCMNYTSHSIF
jgi:hypothetical protein